MERKATKQKEAKMQISTQKLDLGSLNTLHENMMRFSQLEKREGESRNAASGCEQQLL